MRARCDCAYQLCDLLEGLQRLSRPQPPSPPSGVRGGHRPALELGPSGGALNSPAPHTPPCLLLPALLCCHASLATHTHATPGHTQRAACCRPHKNARELCRQAADAGSRRQGAVSRVVLVGGTHTHAAALRCKQQTAHCGLVIQVLKHVCSACPPPPPRCKLSKLKFKNNRFPDLPYDAAADAAAHQKYAEQLKPLVTDTVSVGGVVLSQRCCVGGFSTWLMRVPGCGSMGLSPSLAGVHTHHSCCN
jgi:hypothetical protein